MARHKPSCARRGAVRSCVGKEAMRKRGEIVERSFAHVLERGGMRRTWLRGRQNVHKPTIVRRVHPPKEVSSARTQ